MSQQEALQCVREMDSAELLFVFVRHGLESTLERSTIAREHMGQLLHQLIKTGILPTEQYYKGSVWRSLAVKVISVWFLKSADKTDAKDHLSSTTWCFILLIRGALTVEAECFEKLEKQMSTKLKDPTLDCLGSSTDWFLQVIRLKH